MSVEDIDEGRPKTDVVYSQNPIEIVWKCE